MVYYLAVNAHRSSMGHGFANTWVVYRCRSRQEQKQILDYGLPVADTWTLSGLMYSTFGIRLATRAERAMVARERVNYGIEPYTILTNGMVAP